MKREKKEAQQYSRKPPPYKFIKVWIYGTGVLKRQGFHSYPDCHKSISPFDVQGQQTCGEGSGVRRRHLRDPQVQLQALRREAVRLRVGVSEPHAAVRVPPSGMSQRGALLQPGLHPAALPRHQDHQDPWKRLGAHYPEGHQEGEQAGSWKSAPGFPTDRFRPQVLPLVWGGESGHSGLM